MGSIKLLPLNYDVESKTVLRASAAAHRALAELKGTARSIPNQAILINTLTLLEARDSSAIENIITTQDELFKSSLDEEDIVKGAVKEVQNYSAALKTGFDLIVESELLLNKHILAIQEKLENNHAGYRKQAGTALVNSANQQVVYEPPQQHEQILQLMTNLEAFINDDKMYDADPLVKMAIIHHQFESIHPFYDGNGRTGRIINILYLVLNGLLDTPVLYLSRFINRNKEEYYRLLQSVRDSEEWEEWILFILEGIRVTSLHTVEMIAQMKTAMMKYKHGIRDAHSRFYSQDLVNNLFYHPYTRIEFLMKDLGVSRITATKYLELLSESGYLRKEKIGRSSYYINIDLFDILLKASEE